MMLALGPKRSGEPYSREDRNLLQAVAESLGGLLDREIERAAGTAISEESMASPSARRMWTLADAVARGARIDWVRESDGLSTEADRTALQHLRTLERVMQAHSDPADPPVAEESSVGDVGQWGPFALRATLGGGRSGVVYRAWDSTLEREVAVKLLRPGQVDPEAYLREARRLARLRHPNVVHVYGAATEDGVSGFWMEFVDGMTLADFVAERGPMSPGDVCLVGMAMGRALSAIHKAGLVHQDVKAQNVMREHDGRLVLMDFGAGLVSDEGTPRWGTPRYMAPELFEGDPASARSDIYSLGVLMFFLLSGEFPVEGRTVEEVAAAHRQGRRRRPREFRPEVPDHLADVIERALAAQPVARFVSADELSAAMASA